MGKIALLKPPLNIDVKIEKKDTPLKIATIIYNHFEIFQSCTIIGYIMWKDEPALKGDIVLEFLKEIDAKQRLNNAGGLTLRRKRTVLPNTIGGYVAYRLFKFKHEEIEGKPAVTIWRIQ